MGGHKDKVNKEHRKTGELRAGRDKLRQKTADSRRLEINSYDKDKTSEAWSGRSKAGEVGTDKRPTK